MRKEEWMEEEMKGERSIGKEGWIERCIGIDGWREMED